MSVTPDTSQVEMWPYAASAAGAFLSHRKTAVRIELSLRISVEHSPFSSFCATPQLPPLHGAPSNVKSRTPSSKHQPRSWLKDEA